MLNSSICYWNHNLNVKNFVLRPIRLLLILVHSINVLTLKKKTHKKIRYPDLQSTKTFNIRKKNQSILSISLRCTFVDLLSTCCMNTYPQMYKCPLFSPIIRHNSSAFCSSKWVTYTFSFWSRENAECT